MFFNRIGTDHIGKRAYPLPAKLSFDANADDGTVEQLYSPAMLAELIHVNVRVIRRWHQADLIRAVRIVMKLPYFDYSQIATAKRLSQWMKQGVSIQSIQKQLRDFRVQLGEDVTLDTLPLIVKGKKLVLRSGDMLIESSGQLHFGFDASSDDQPATIRFAPRTDTLSPNLGEAPQESLEAMVNAALLAEDSDHIDEAIGWYRTALGMYGPNPDICFQLAELLYRIGDVGGARERYYMAIELDPNLVEARANLGCVLAECGQTELAIAAFEGTLQQFDEYADVHFHIARALDDVGQSDRAVHHWQRFIDLAPASPWAEEAAERLKQVSPLLNFEQNEDEPVR